MNYSYRSASTGSSDAAFHGGQQRDDANDERPDAHSSGDLTERGDQRVVRVNLEIILVTEFQSARDTHRSDRFVQRLVVCGLRGRLRGDVHRPPLPSEVAEEL